MLLNSKEVLILSWVPIQAFTVTIFNKTYIFIHNTNNIFKRAFTVSTKFDNSLCADLQVAITGSVGVFISFKQLQQSSNIVTIPQHLVSVN